MRMPSVWTGLLLSALSLPATAAGAPPADMLADAIIVTAARLPQPADQVGSSISLVTRGEIIDRQATTVGDILRELPGIAVARSGPVGAQTQVRMRGAEANQVLVLIDGVAANDLAGADEFAFEHMNTFDIERIEVVRGPQSALWGSDALAGVINIVTRQPATGLHTEAFLEGGSFGTTNGGAWVGGRTGRGHASASASRFDTGGTNAARSGTENDGYDNSTVSLTAGFEATPALALDASYRHTSAGKDYDGESIFTGLPADDANGDGRVDVFHSDVRQDYLRVGASWDPLDGRWTHQLRYGLTDTSTRTRAEDLYSPGIIDHTRQAGHKTGLYYQTSILTRTDAHGNPADVLTLAVDHQREAFRQRGRVTSYDFDSDGIPDLVFDPNQDPSMNRTGYVAEYLARIGPHFTATASARHDRYSAFENADTWRGTVSWRPAGGPVRAHASLGTGVKTPTFTERFGYYPAQFVGNPALRPEQSTGWDAGIERRFADGQVVADLTYFHADLEHEIDGTYCCTHGLYTAVNRPEDSRRRGVEFSASARASDTWTLNAAYTYTDAREPAPGGSRRHELRRPWHTAALNLDGKWWSGRLGLNAGIAYTGRRLDNYYDASFTPVRVSLASYTLVTLAAHYDITRTLSLYGRVENALDESYEDVYGFNTPGMAGYVGLRLGMGR